MQHWELKLGLPVPGLIYEFKTILRRFVLKIFYTLDESRCQRNVEDKRCWIKFLTEIQNQDSQSQSHEQNKPESWIYINALGYSTCLYLHTNIKYISKLHKLRNFIHSRIITITIESTEKCVRRQEFFTENSSSVLSTCYSDQSSVAESWFFT